MVLLNSPVRGAVDLTVHWLWSIPDSCMGTPVGLCTLQAALPLAEPLSQRGLKENTGGWKPRYGTQSVLIH